MFHMQLMIKHQSLLIIIIVIERKITLLRKEIQKDY